MGGWWIEQEYLGREDVGALTDLARWIENVVGGGWAGFGHATRAGTCRLRRGGGDQALAVVEVAGVGERGTAGGVGEGGW